MYSYGIYGVCTVSFGRVITNILYCNVQCNYMVWPTLRNARDSGLPEPYIYGIYTVFLIGKSLNTRSCTMYIYGSGQP